LRTPFLRSQFTLCNLESGDWDGVVGVSPALR
jgi:hypothetical protein